MTDTPRTDIDRAIAALDRAIENLTDLPGSAPGWERAALVEAVERAARDLGFLARALVGGEPRD